MIAIIMELIIYPYLDLFLHGNHNRYKDIPDGCHENQAFLAGKKQLSKEGSVVNKADPYSAHFPYLRDLPYQSYQDRKFTSKRNLMF